MTEMSSIIGILLAAGTSSRFGLDKLTQRLPSSGELVALQACRHLLAGADGVLAVVRPGSEALAAQLQSIGAQVRVCTNASQGMGTSLAFGISACPDADGWLIALADMPWIAPATIVKVADALRSGATIAAPVWQSRRGHPVGFSSTMHAELAALRGDIGAKALIQTNLEQLSLVDCYDPGVLWDIDQPDDMQNRPYPT
ncbi:MAG: nucleotidyltransferase family protein [Methylomonas sp.]